MGDKGKHEQDDKDEKQKLGDIRRPCGDPAKTKDRRDNGDDKENRGPIKHANLLLFCDTAGRSPQLECLNGTQKVVSGSSAGGFCPPPA